MTILKPVDFKAVAAKGAYVYCYLRFDGTPYYVGIAKEGNWKRPFARHSCKPPTQNRQLVRVMKSGLSFEEACKWEQFYIAWYGRKDIDTNGILRNISAGGKSGTYGVKWDREIVEKRAAACRGKTHRKRTAEENEANRQRGLGKKQSAETCAKRSASSKGHKKSAETRARMSAAWTGVVRTQESKDNQAITNAQETADRLGVDVREYITLDRASKQRINRAYDKGVRGAALMIAAQTIGRSAMHLFLKQYAAA